jgi:hypothetical protein
MTWPNLHAYNGKGNARAQQIDLMDANIIDFLAVRAGGRDPLGA